jgi:hypothetical protein
MACSPYLPFCFLLNLDRNRGGAMHPIQIYRSHARTSAYTGQLSVFAWSCGLRATSVVP